MSSFSTNLPNCGKRMCSSSKRPEVLQSLTAELWNSSRPGANIQGFKRSPLVSLSRLQIEIALEVQNRMRSPLLPIPWRGLRQKVPRSCGERRPNNDAHLETESATLCRGRDNARKCSRKSQCGQTDKLHDEAELELPGCIHSIAKLCSGKNFGPKVRNQENPHPVLASGRREFCFWNSLSIGKQSIRTCFISTLSRNIPHKHISDFLSLVNYPLLQSELGPFHLSLKFVGALPVSSLKDVLSRSAPLPLGLPMNAHESIYHQQGSAVHLVSRVDSSAREDLSLKILTQPWTLIYPLKLASLCSESLCS